MSWAIFKANILRSANNPESLTDLQNVADLWVTEYDSAIKRGRDIVNLAGLKLGNTEIAKQLFYIALLQGQSSTIMYDLIGAMGKGVTAYWAGATLNEFPIPLIPAPGSIQNIQVVSNVVINPGTWTPQPPLPPTNNTSLIIDLFIATATLHLSTISGIINTVSLYPGVPPIPGPGVIPWTGYQVPPAVPGVAIPTIPSPQLDSAIKKIEAAEPTISDENKKAIEEQIDTIKETRPIEETEPDIITIDDEFIEKSSVELESGKYISTDVDFTEEEADAVTGNTDENLVSEYGLKVVKIARGDIGIQETLINGADGNSGGKQNPNGRFETPTQGRIDYMLDTNCGKTNWQSYGSKSKVGLPWCAAAVTTWYKEAGLPTPPTSWAAGVKEWKTWGVNNGYWYPVKPNFKPKLGSACIYESSTKGAYHIGIVSSVQNDGTFTTIEGNTSGKQGDRDGGGCFEKTPRKGLIGGFITPSELNKS